MDVIPATRPISPRHTAHAEFHLRYEDLNQDGRLRVIAVPECLARTVWSQLIGPSRVYRKLTKGGIVPVLTRLSVAGGEGPLSVNNPVMATGRCRFAHTLDDDAEIQRIVLNMWGDLTGPRASTHDPQPPNGAGDPILAGRVFAEHTLTRPFAPSGARAVRSLQGIEGLSPFPKARYLGESPRALAALPRGAKAVGPAILDTEPVLFGLDDTDANQHVNALVYPRLFRVAALRHLARQGATEKRMMRTLEIGFRKPSFAGDCSFIRVRTYHHRGSAGALCTLGPEDPDATPRCYARLTFSD